MERKQSINPIHKGKFTREEYMLEFFQYNKAYIHTVESSSENKNSLLQQMRNRYQWYRNGWRKIPKEAIERGLSENFVKELHILPFCVDIEVTSICDLACPFCFRQSIATPDNLMAEELVYQNIDQAAKMNVPSIKFNWRGEPLMHPKLPKFIAYAKKKGISETLINTNATRLTRKTAEDIIEAGLDVMIYSFDGSSKDTYNKSRPGRFTRNDFDAVYGNIRNMAEVKRKKGAYFPFTKIQMVLTKETFWEKENFYKLFSDCVDEVTTTPYTERGGNLKVLKKFEQALIQNSLSYHQRDKEKIEFWKDFDGTLYIENGRLPCEQIFQRLLVSYDGKVFMCCYDWGNEHPIGYVSDYSFERGDVDYQEVVKNAQQKKAGFELMNVIMPQRKIKIPKVVKTLKEIWDGDELNNIRKLHVRSKMDSVDICKKCTFKETYSWKPIGKDAR